MPPQVQSWAPACRQPLPFATTTVLSADDPYSATERSVQLAADWGSSEVVTVASAGHMNAESGLGDWPDGVALLRALATRTGVEVL